MAVSAGLSGREGVRVAAGAAAQTFRVRVIGVAAATGACTATLRDGASCDPTTLSEATSAFVLYAATGAGNGPRLTKSAGRVRLDW